MKKEYSLASYILLFIFVQIAWLSILGLWIARFVTNYVIFKQIGEKYSTSLESGGTIAIFVIGLALLIGVYVGIVLIFRHLSIQFKLARLYDNFIANVTHELKTPLASIQLYLDTMSSQKIPQKKQYHFISIMQKDTDRLKKLVNTILEIAGLERKKNIYNCSICEAGTTIKDIIDEITSQLQLPDSSIKVNNSINQKFVIDRNALKIVFDNLIDNSRKYSRNKVEISIDIKQNRKDIIIEYRDNGIGFPMREHKQIFNKFHRVVHPEMPSVKGTGLGLAWVKEIIKYHGGKIRAHSQGLNRGATFIIELPIYLTAKKRFLKKLLRTSNG